MIDFVNSDATARLGFDILAKTGKLILVGVAGGELKISLATMIFRNTSIQAVLTGGLRDLRELVALARDGTIPAAKVTTMPKDRANEAMTSLLNGDIVGRAVLVS